MGDKGGNMGEKGRVGLCRQLHLLGNSTQVMPFIFESALCGQIQKVPNKLKLNSESKNTASLLS